MRQNLYKLVWGMALLFAASIPSAVFASDFGQGVFGANVPFGSATSISIALGGNVALPLSANGATFTGIGAHTVTVTSTDVVGYLLYAHPTGSTALTNGTSTIPASNNVTATTLTAGSWGYNTNNSTTNFLGMPAAGALLKDATGPFKSGDPTTITYGAVTSATQDAGNYAIAITYTAVAKNP